MSPWHDVALRNEDGTLNFVCEIPKDTSAKFELATVPTCILPHLSASLIVTLQHSQSYLGGNLVNHGR